MSKKMGTNRITAWLLTLAMLVTVLSGFSITAFAAEAANSTCGENLTWTLDEEGTLTISGTGAMADYDWEESLPPWADYEVITVVIESGVTTIGAYAFDSYSELTSVTIPEGVESIGEGAFYRCESLKSVEIPEGVETIGEGAFYRCESLESVEIPEGIETIGEYAFYGCTGLKSVTISEGVKTIGKYAFCECAGLTSIEIPSSVEVIGNGAFNECTGLKSVTISEGVKTIGNYAFYGCRALESLTIPDGLETIGEAVFYKCYSLESVTIPDSVKTIGMGAFYMCSSLTSVTIPESIETIEMHTFFCCENLESVTIPEGVKNIEDSAFSGCKKLASITFPEGLENIGIYAFYGCESFTSVIIPEGVKSIGDAAFVYCEELTSVQIPSSVESIGSNAFYGCEKLETITIPEGVKTIGESAFYLCDGLTSIEISSSVESIGDYAFYGCNSLLTIEVSEDNENYTSIDGVLFSKDQKTLIKYPSPKDVSEYVIPDGTVTIANGAFSDCDNLTSITITGSVEDVSAVSFLNCKNLVTIEVSEDNENYTSIDGVLFSKDGKTLIKYPCPREASEYAIPDGTVTIGENAFSGCNNLTLITIPESVETIDVDAFFDCNNLSAIEVSEDNANYTSIYGVLFSKDKTTLLGCPEGKTSEFIIPDGTVTIAEGAFSYCKNLESVTIPSSVAVIPDNAFYYCRGLTSVDISEGVETIGAQAFYKCSGLATIAIPSSVTSIGDFAFSDCEGIMVYVESNEPAELGIAPFNNGVDPIYVAASKIFVPEDAVETYRDDWYNYKDIIEPGYQNAKDWNVEFSATTNSITVTWDELRTVGTDGVEYYTVYCYPYDGDYEDAVTATYPTTDTVPFTHTFSGLEYDSIYNVGVSAEYQSGHMIDYEDSAETLGDISYIDENGNTQFCTEYSVITSGTTALSEGWYVVIGDVTVENSIAASGDIHLILTDGSKLTVISDEKKSVYTDGNLSIYAQSCGDSMGELEVKSSLTDGYGIDVEKALNIRGGVITAEGEKFGMSAVAITISGGDVYAKSNSVNSLSIYATSNIDITGGVVETATGELGYGIYSYRGNIAISGGSVKAAGDAFGITAFGYEKGETDADTGIGNITISGGIVDAYSEAEGGIGIYASGMINIYGDEISRYPIENPYFTCTVNIYTNDSCAIHAAKGITVGDTLAITTPEGGVVKLFSNEDESFYAIAQSDEGFAADVTIKPVLYSVLIENLSSTAMKVDVPVGRSVNEAYKDFCQKLYGTDNFSDYINGYTEKDGYVFNGFYTESGEKFDFDAPVDGDVTITPKWTKESSGGDGVIISYTVKFETNGGSTISNKSVTKNSKLTEPTEPAKDGYSFIGWFTDEELTAAYDFDSKVTKSFTLYAGWEKTEEENPVEVKNPFTDVNASDWYYEDVIYAVENGLFNGTTKTTFAPDDKLTRAMLVTVLYRVEGEPEITNDTSFTDVDMGAYYANAVIWAQQNGIVNGVSETEFDPDSNITREQIAAIIYRWAVYRGMEAVTMEENLHFADSDKISEYAVSAMNWAVGSGLMKGKTESTLNPHDNATRAECAAILHRFIEADN